MITLMYIGQHESHLIHQHSREQISLIVFKNVEIRCLLARKNTMPAEHLMSTKVTIANNVLASEHESAVLVAHFDHLSVGYSSIDLVPYFFC